MSADRMLFAVALFMGSTGCGSLVNGDYRGEVLFEIEGQVYTDGFETDGEVNVALLWSTAPEANLGSQAVVVKTSFPARYTIQIFEPPAQSSVLQFFGNDEIQAAVADIILYADNNGDGAWDRETEEIVGGAFDSTVIWVESVGEFTTAVNMPVGPGEELWTPEPGFAVVRRLAPFSCVQPWEQWLQPVPDQRADLEVSYFFPSAFDWDCDGEDNWVQGPDLFGEECDPFLFEGECAYIEDLLADIQTDPAFVSEQAGFLLDDGFLTDCLAQNCPDVVDALFTAASAGP